MRGRSAEPDVAAVTDEQGEDLAGTVQSVADFLRAGTLGMAAEFMEDAEGLPE